MGLLDRLQLAWMKFDQDRSIRRHGWTGVFVGNYVTPPTWVYTVGFDETLNHPEIVVFDVPQPIANGLLWRVFNDVRAGALTIEDGRAWEVDLPKPVVWRKVHPGHVDQWLTFACMRRHKRTGKADGLEAYQLVLSDSEGVLPWEPGYKEESRPFQPALYEPPEALPMLERLHRLIRLDGSLLAGLAWMRSRGAVRSRVSRDPAWRAHPGWRRLGGPGAASRRLASGPPHVDHAGVVRRRHVPPRRTQPASEHTEALPTRAA